MMILALTPDQRISSTMMAIHGPNNRKSPLETGERATRSAALYLSAAVLLSWGQRDMMADKEADGTELILPNSRGSRCNGGGRIIGSPITAITLSLLRAPGPLAIALAKVRLTLNSSVPLEHLSVRDTTGTIIFGETSGYLSGDELDLDCTSDIGQILILREYGYPRILGIEFYVRGEPGGEDSGAAYVFRFDGSSWSKQAKLIPEDSEAGDHFGASVGLDGDYAIVGAYGKDYIGEDSGCAYIFKFDGSRWVEQFKLVASDAQAGDRFGASVSISSDYAIVGADSNDGEGTDSGAAYVFRRYGSVWTQQAKLTASDGRSWRSIRRFCFHQRELRRHRCRWQRRERHWNQEPYMFSGGREPIGYSRPNTFRTRGVRAITWALRYL